MEARVWSIPEDAEDLYSSYGGEDDRQPHLFVALPKGSGFSSCFVLSLIWCVNSGVGPHLLVAGCAVIVPLATCVQTVVSIVGGDRKLVDVFQRRNLINQPICWFERRNAMAGTIC
jgi:hypothetical protein